MGEMTSSPQIVGKIYGPTLVNKMASKCHEFTNKTELDIGTVQTTMQ